MKRIVSFILSAVMLAASLSVVSNALPITTPDNIDIPDITEVETFIPGDADGNGEVNALDSYAVKCFVAYGTVVADPDAADLNVDGKVSAKDSFCLKSVFAGQNSLSDYEINTSLGKFSIGGVDITEFEIVLPEGTVYDDNKYLGYEYLSKYLKIATGFSIPLTYGEQSTTGHGIYFNTVDYHSEYGQTLGVDGYCYKVQNGNLMIYGTLRGNGYAVFDILERYLGFLFCASDRAYAFVKRTSDIPADCEKTYVPQFRIRSASGAENNDYYSRIRGINSMINESSWYNNAYIGYISGDAIGTVHSFDEYRAIIRGKLPSDEDTTTNYYAKAADGMQYVDTSSQVCACSDEAYEEIFAGMLMWIQHISDAPGKYFESEYGITYASFGLSDNQKFCPCRICGAISQGTSYNRATDSNIEWVEKNYGGEYSVKTATNKTKSIVFKKEYYVGLYLNMINRAARDIQEYYPGVKVLTYFYPNDIPETVRPEPNVYLWYCGACNPACVKHTINDECHCNRGSEGLITTEEMLGGIEGWRKICDETGAELGYWCYFTNYGSQIFALPNYDMIYGTIHKIAEIGLDGAYYECGSIHTNPLEAKLKVFLAQEMIWNPDITYEEFRELIRKYLLSVYGDAWEDIYQYILMSEEAMNSNNRCFAFWYKVFDVYSKDYMNAHYMEMRSLLESAREKVRPEKVKDIDYMLAALDLIGLSAVHEDWYLNGSEAQRLEYCKMYDSLYNSIITNGFHYGDINKMPASISYDKSPAVQFYVYEHQHGN